MDTRKGIKITKFILFFSVLHLVLLGCSKTNPVEEVKEVAVEVITLARKEIVNEVVLTAQLQPNQNVMIFPKTPGLEVTSVGVKLGQMVREGDFLFELDKRMVRKQVEQSKIAYDKAKENYNTQRSQLNLPTEELELPSREVMFRLGRQNPLSPLNTMDLNGISNSGIGSGGNNQLPGNVMPNPGPEAALAPAQAQLEQSRMAYSSALEQLGEMEYFAPISGTVSQLNVQENQMVLNTQPAVVLTNGSNLKASLHVGESLWKTLQLGETVRVTIGDEETLGKIHALNPVADPRSSLYVAEIMVNNEQGKWQSGTFGKIRIEREKRADTLTIPKDALIKNGKEYQVFVVEDNKAIQKRVITGIEGGSEVEIVEGLAEGDQVIVKGHHYVQDQTPVIVVRGEQNEVN